MHEPVPDCRLEEIRADLTCAYQAPEWYEIVDMAHDVFGEIDRLRAENERLLKENLELKMQPVFEEHRS